ncbi:MAG: type III-B CRISPR module RAMP protein Cmr4 [Acidobacteriota bacterium]|uniref:Type III-B CRISPR module RAMP protein Cmr4 n=1 Tax=Thermoanaerobaculum aquaticum TaxID=1312852 RepID=A0A7V1ZHY0_9BACT
MFEKRALMFLYAISPVHMGAGQAIGVVDNPIQREKHTNHPILAGSGLKGALRDVFQAKEGDELTGRIFGPEASASDHAGAVSFSDAGVVLFPVRSLRESYAYVTSPTALARLRRAAQLCELELDWQVPEVSNDSQCLVASSQSKLLFGSGGQGAGQRLVLETFEFQAEADEEVAKVAAWLASRAILSEDGFHYFREKLKKDLVVLSDTRFKYYVENGTIVEPHVRINDELGTADDGGLFYTENVPPEALFVSLMLASRERVKKGAEKDQILTSSEVLKALVETLHGEVVQIGGDATTGRGLVALSVVSKS